MMKDDFKIVKISIDKIEENPWNPNAQSDVKFNKLTEEIETMGFLDPIQVVPWKGKYRIIGGAHRYNAALILGYTEMPCVILDDKRFQDEDLQKFVTLRLNLIKGNMTPKKFQALYEDLSKRHSEEAIRAEMALVDRGEWDVIKKKLLGQLKEAVKGTAFEDNFDDVVKELKTIDDITKLLEMVYAQKDTMPGERRVFSLGLGGGKIISFDINPQIYERLLKLKDYLVVKDMTIDEYLYEKIL